MSYVSNQGSFNVTGLIQAIKEFTDFQAQDDNWQKNYPDRETFVEARLKLIEEMKRQTLVELNLWQQAADDTAADLAKRTKNSATADAIAGTLTVLGPPGIVLGLGVSLANLIFKRDLKKDIAYEQERFAAAVKPYQDQLAELVEWERKYIAELEQIKLVKTGTYAVAGYIAYQLLV